MSAEQGTPELSPEPGAPARDEATRKLWARLRRAMGRAVGDFDLIAEGDRILCAVSGGKDSYVMHELLSELGRRAPVSFELCAVNVDQGHPGYPREVLHDYMAARSARFVMVREDTYSVVKEKVPPGKTTCSLCSRLRRGILYRIARELGCNKIALGHHRDDAVVTLMLNLLFAGQLKAMPPKLVCDEGDIVVIRPLSYCSEDDIAAYARARAYPIVPCVLCSGQDLERRTVSDMLAEVEARHPGIRDSMLAALGNVRPSHLFDAGLWRKLGLSVARDEGEPTPGGGVVPLRRRPRASALDGSEGESLGVSLAGEGRG
jgi:tRNA 2-thiocytidine biosynthesis protein TtcA